MPSEDLNENREIFKGLTEQLYQEAKASAGKIYLNLGCGKGPRGGFVNIDKYTIHPGIMRCDMYRLPFKPDTVDLIYSSHSIEHLPLRHGHVALRDWYQVLKPGGRLFICMPDLYAIMRFLLDPGTQGYAREWYMYCLFGFQADTETPRGTLDPPVDHGQFHCSGFSMDTFIPEIQSIGYKVLQSFNYEGWGTPSFFVEAVK